MTPNWLPQMNWMNMPRAGKTTGQGIAEGVGAIGTALLRRGEDDEEGVQPPAYRPPVQVPSIQEPPIPVAPLPQYGARPEDESELLKRKSQILSMLR